MISALTVKIGADIDNLRQELQAATKGLRGFQSSLMSIAGTLGIAFGVREIASFTVEIHKLAGEAQGVGAAFNKLPNATTLMHELKEATGGTVSELDLMKRAVQASNFDISLQALPKLLEFATLRAQQTGQSVDYLVDSIVTGIGRKSKLILDNLGISAVQLDEKLGGVSVAAASVGQVADAVGEIASESLSQMGKLSENTATKMQRLAASWENFKVAMGDAANEAGILGGAIDGLTASLDILASKHLSRWDKLMAVIGGPQAAAEASTKAIVKAFQEQQREAKKQETVIRNVDRAFVEFKGNIDEFAKAINPNHPLRGAFLEEFRKRVEEAAGEVQKQVETYESLKATLAKLNSTFNTTDTNDRARQIQIAQEIGLIEEKIKALDAIRKLEFPVKVAPLPTLDMPELDTFNVLRGTAEVEAAFQAMGASINTSLINTDMSLEAWAAAMRIHFQEGMKHAAMMHNIVTSAISGVARSLGEAIAGGEDFGKALLGVFGNIMVQLGEYLIATGVGIEAFKGSLKSLNGVAAIAAGVTLVALGSAIASSIKNLGETAGRSSGSISRNAAHSSGAGTRGNINDQGIEIMVGGSFRVQGEDLVYIFNRRQQKNGRVRG